MKAYSKAIGVAAIAFVFGGLLFSQPVVATHGSALKVGLGNSSVVLDYLRGEAFRKAAKSCPLYDPTKNQGTHRSPSLWHVRATGAHLAHDYFRAMEKGTMDFVRAKLLPTLENKGFDALVNNLRKAMKLSDTSSVPAKQILFSKEFRSALDSLAAKKLIDNDVLEGWRTKSADLLPIVRVGVVDTGIDLTHPMFEGRYPLGDYRNNLEANTEGGISFPSKSGGHGTHVAGTILQLGYAAEVVSLGIFGRDSTDQATSDAYENAAKLGVKLTNGSWGFSIFDDNRANRFREVLDKTTAQGLIHIMAQGNSGNTARVDHFYPRTIGTGSLNEVGDRSYFSQNHPAFVAYGETLYAPQSGNMEEEWNKVAVRIPWGEGKAPLIPMRGTSMASPTLTALSTIPVSLLPDLQRDELFEILRAAAQTIGPKGVAESTGHGLPNAWSVLQLSLALKKQLKENPALAKRRAGLLAELAKAPAIDQRLSKELGELAASERKILEEAKAALVVSGAKEFAAAEKSAAALKANAGNASYCADLESFVQQLERAYFSDPGNPRYAAALAAFYHSLGYEGDFLRLYGPITEKSQHFLTQADVKALRERLAVAKYDYTRVAIAKVLMRHTGSETGKLEILADLAASAVDTKNKDSFRSENPAIKAYLRTLPTRFPNLGQTIREAFLKMDPTQKRAVIRMVPLVLPAAGSDLLKALYAKEANPGIQLELAARLSGSYGDESLHGALRDSLKQRDVQERVKGWLAGDNKDLVENETKAHFFTKFGSDELFPEYLAFYRKATAKDGIPFRTRENFYEYRTYTYNAIDKNTGRVPWRDLIAIYSRFYNCYGREKLNEIVRQIHRDLSSAKNDEAKKEILADVQKTFRENLVPDGGDEQKLPSLHCLAQMVLMKRLFEDPKREKSVDEVIVETLPKSVREHKAYKFRERDILRYTGHSYSWLLQGSALIDVVAARCEHKGDPLRCVDFETLALNNFSIDDEDPAPCLTLLNAPPLKELRKLSDTKEGGKNYEDRAQSSLAACGPYLKGLAQRNPEVFTRLWNGSVVPRIETGGLGIMRLPVFYSFYNKLCSTKETAEVCRSEPMKDLLRTSTRLSLTNLQRKGDVSSPLEYQSSRDFYEKHELPKFLEAIVKNQAFRKLFFDELLARNKSGGFSVLDGGAEPDMPFLWLEHLDSALRNGRLEGKAAADYAEFRRYWLARYVQRSGGEMLQDLGWTGDAPAVEYGNLALHAILDEANRPGVDPKKRDRLYENASALHFQPYFTHQDSPKLRDAVTKLQKALGKPAAYPPSAEKDDRAFLAGLAAFRSVVADLDAGKLTCDQWPAKLAHIAEKAARKEDDARMTTWRITTGVVVQTASKAATLACLETKLGESLFAYVPRSALPRAERDTYYKTALAAAKSDEVYRKIVDVMANEEGRSFKEMKDALAAYETKYKKKDVYDPFRGRIVLDLHSEDAKVREAAVKDFVDIIETFTGTYRGMNVSLGEVWGGVGADGQVVLRTLFGPESRLTFEQKSRVVRRVFELMRDERAARFISPLIEAVRWQTDSPELRALILRYEREYAATHDVALWHD